MDHDTYCDRPCEFCGDDCAFAMIACNDGHHRCHKHLRIPANPVLQAISGHQGRIAGDTEIFTVNVVNNGDMTVGRFYRATRLRGEWFVQEIADGDVQTL